ncbi:MAG: alpha/beta fold hydrolase [Pseudomonadota bacterium]
MLFTALRMVLRGVDWVSPKAAGEVAHWLFQWPPPSEPTSPEQRRLLVEAERRFAEGARKTVACGDSHVVTYRLPAEGAPRGTAVLVHGWTSRALHLGQYAERLRSAGYDVVCIDLPAHGASPGRLTNARQAADALQAVIADLGGVDLLLGHSFGGGVICLALRNPAIAALAPRAKIVLMSSPNQFSHVTGGVGAALGLSAEAQRHFERRAFALVGVTEAEGEGNPTLRKVGLPVLVLHCRNDQEIAFSQAERWLEVRDLVTLFALEGVGHRNILFDRQALDRVVTFARGGDRAARGMQRATGM